MLFYIAAGSAVLALLYGVFYHINKHDGAPRLLRPVTILLMPVGMLMFITGALITILLMFIMQVTTTIRGYSKSRFA